MITKKRKVLATTFDDSTGCYNDNNLDDGGYYYGELSKDYKKKDYSALGKLPEGHQLKIYYHGKSIVAEKGDKGAGGKRNPKIDLHTEVYKKLGFPENNDEYVEIIDADYASD